MMRLNNPDFMSAYSITLPSPDGSVTVHCNELVSGQLHSVIINIGKAGHSIASWADALSRTINLALTKKTTIDEILEQLSNITTGKSVFHPNHRDIRSAPDAIVRALILYKNTTRVEKNDSRSLPRMSIPADW